MGLGFGLTMNAACAHATSCGLVYEDLCQIIPPHTAENNFMSSNAGGSQFWQELRVINPAALQQQLYSWQEDIWAGLPELIHESSQWQDLITTKAVLTQTLLENLPLAGISFAALALIVLLGNKAGKAQMEADSEMHRKRKELDQAAKDQDRRKRALQVREQERLRLKKAMLKAVERLGKDAMMPGASPECDAIEQLVERLETLNPLSKPLDNSIEKLSGDWVLLYASKGTSMWNMQVQGQSTVSIAELTQQINQEQGQLVGMNAANVRIGSLGTWRVTAKGLWEDSGDGVGADVGYQTVSVVPVELFGMPISIPVPEVELPMPTALQDQGGWLTSYLDEDIRIGRDDPAKNIYIFRRRNGSGDVELKTFG